MKRVQSFNINDLLRGSRCIVTNSKYFIIYNFLLILLLGSQACQQTQNENSAAAEPKNDILFESKEKDISIIDLYNNHLVDTNLRDLDAIKESGVLKAITTYSSTSYFIYRGIPMGFEFELLQRLADYLEVELEIVVAKDNMDLFKQLYQGNADIIAHGITITTPRKAYLHFTDYIILSHQVLVQKKPDNWRNLKLHEIQERLINDPIELIGDTISVREKSSYVHRLDNLMEEMGGLIEINKLPGNMETDEIIEMLVDGQIKYTVADNHLASINASFYPELDIHLPISFSQRIAWATRKTSPELTDEINKWLKEIKKTADFNVTYKKYFTNTRDFRKRTNSEFYSLNEGKISKYDDLIKKYSQPYDWDWRLISSLVYQESQFNPGSKSWVDAQGLMQLMPATAKELGVEDISDPDDNVKGGTKYLRQMWDRWDVITDTVQRIKFSMASYNCGYYHVVDARNLTRINDGDENIWDDNVELYLLKLSKPEFFNDPIVKYGYARGIEPYTYVKEIFERYAHYTKFIPN